MSTEQPKPLKVCLVGAASSGKTTLVGRFKNNEFEEDISTIGVAFTPKVVTVPTTSLQQSFYHSTYLSRFFNVPDHKSIYPTVPQVENPDAQQYEYDISDPNYLQNITLHIWDTAGSERYAVLARKYYLGAEACIVCYDLTSEQSWEKLDTWIQQVQDACPEVLLVIVGCKKDLIVPLPRELARRHGVSSHKAAQDRAVSVEQVRSFALSAGAVVFETSSKFDQELPSCDYAFDVFNFITNECVYRREQARQSQQGKKNVANTIDVHQKAAQQDGGCC